MARYRVIKRFQMWPLQPTTGFRLIDYMPPSEICLARCVEMPRNLETVIFIGARQGGKATRRSEL